MKLYEPPTEPSPDAPASELPDPQTILDGPILLACFVVAPLGASFLLGCLLGLIVVGFRWVAG